MDGVRVLVALVALVAIVTAVLVSFGVLAFFRRRVLRSITPKLPQRRGQSPSRIPPSRRPTERPGLQSRGIR